MSPKLLVACFALGGFFLMAVAGVSASKTIEGVASPARPQQNRVLVAPYRARPNWWAEGDREFAYFGWSVGTAGDVNGDGYPEVIVGAPNYSKAFVYYGSASGPSPTPDWIATGDQEFGISVATAGDVNGDGYDDVIVGARGFDGYRGRAFAYYGSASGLSPTPNWVATGDQGGAEFGGSVGTAGDVNGDGYDDVIVGAQLYGNGQMYEGRAFAYYGSDSGLSLSPNWTAESDDIDAAFGYSVGTAGDVNGDAYADVIVGAPGVFGGYNTAFVYHGSAAGLPMSPNWTAEETGEFGTSVSKAGDVNGDGYDDVIVGAWTYGQLGEGAAFVYHGSGSGLSLTPDWIAESDQTSSGFGQAVGTSGDVNSDGYDDVIVGAFRYDNGQTDEGRVFGFFGSASGLSPEADRMAESNQTSANFGYAVGTAGDVDGDGYDDVIVGDFGYDHGQEDEGIAVVFRGRATLEGRR